MLGLIHLRLKLQQIQAAILAIWRIPHGIKWRRIVMGYRPVLHKIDVHIIYVSYCITGNHYKWDWPKSQFCMLNILATIDWLRNLKVANIYFFNILQNTLKIFSFSKLEIRKLENLIFPSSAEPCRILQNSALVPQNSAAHFGEKLRNSADFCRILQNSAEKYVPQICSAEQQNPITFRRSLRNWINLSCRILRVTFIPQNSSAELCIVNPFCGLLYNW